jgi:hypothetical protein
MAMRETDVAGIDFAFWPAPVRHHGYESHLVAARAGEFNSMVISPTTYAEARARGLSTRDIRAMAEEQGYAAALPGLPGLVAKVRVFVDFLADRPRSVQATASRADVCRGYGPRRTWDS